MHATWAPDPSEFTLESPPLPPPPTRPSPPKHTCITNLMCGSNFRRLLFAKDFKRHMEAADIILGQLGDLPREAMSCMDLLLRWLVLRICDANTQCLLKVLALTKALFLLMIHQVMLPFTHANPSQN